jgi:hypothetical protein
MKRETNVARLSTLCITIGLLITGCSTAPVELSDEDIDNIVRRSFQYVVMYNVINKGAMMPENPMMAPWNTTKAAPGLLDHTMRGIARPNNDTLYVATLLDLRAEPIIVHYPEFDSKYVVLETSAYDHYIDTPLSTTEGDFKQPTKVLYYTARTEGYSGEPVEGVEIVKEMTGDFAGAFLRVMPHGAEPERMKRNLAAMQEVRAQTLSEYLGNPAKPVVEAAFPAYSSDAGVYENNFLEVMQFVFNHTTFDPTDRMDQEVLAALGSLGIEPGKEFDPSTVAEIDGKRLAEVAGQIVQESLATWNRPEGNPHQNDVFLPKGQMTLEPMVAQSAFGPIGLPAHQAVYPGIPTASGEPMNAQNDYVIRIPADELPPAKAFWSVTLYDAATGQFIPNDRKKYSVGENAGMRLDADGAIEIHIAAEQPEGVPEENWLPSSRKDEDMDLVMRIYAPDPDKLAAWTVPRAEIAE